MTSKVKTTRLGNIASYSSDRISYSHLTAQNYIGTDNILQNRAGIKNSQYVPTKGAFTKYQKGDVLLANIRPYLQKIWYADREGGNSADVSTLRLTNSSYDQKFVYYNLFQEIFFDYAMKGAKGSKMPRLDKSQILNFPIADFDLPAQKAIAGILSSLDDKITLNNKINSELEQTVHLIYKYWFTQFDFPDENGMPYKKSGGKLTYNAKLKREIPIHWSMKHLGDIVSRSGTGLNPRDNFKLGYGNNYYVTIKSVENGKVVLDDRCDKIDDLAFSIIQKRSDLQVGDILFTSIQPVGITYLIQEKPVNWNINESVFTLRPNYSVSTSEFLYMLLSSEEMKCFTENSSAGSIHKGIRHSVLKNFKLACPDMQLIEKFTSIVKPMLREIYINDEENRQLVKLRDWLLPMLMTGQVKIMNKEIK